MPRKPYKSLPLRAVHNLAFDAHTGIAKQTAVQRARAIEPQTPPHIVRKLYDRFAGLESEEHVRAKLADYERRKKVKDKYWQKFSGEERSRMRKQVMDRIPLEKRLEMARRAKETWFATATPEERAQAMRRDSQTLTDAQLKRWENVPESKRRAHMKKASEGYAQWVEGTTHETRSKIARTRNEKIGKKRLKQIAKKRQRNIPKEKRKEIAQRMLAKRGGEKALNEMREHSALQQQRIAGAMKDILRVIAIPKEPGYALAKELLKMRNRKNYSTAAAISIELAIRTAQEKKSPERIQKHLKNAISYLELEAEKPTNNLDRMFEDIDREMQLRGLIENLKVLAKSPKAFAYAIRRKRK